MGEDKAFLKWNGTTFLELSIAAAKPLSAQIFLSGDKNRLGNLGYQIIEDLRPGNGPVYALATCFAQVKTENVLVLSCDVPQITTADLLYLIEEHFHESDVTCYTYKDKTLPLIGIYHRRSFYAFAEAMQSGERKVFSVLEKLNVTPVAYKGVNGLQNINTPQDLKELQ